MIKLKSIKKVYVTEEKKTNALKGVSIDMRKAEFVCILGPSGCGKTTLLNIIGGLDRYSSGDLIINGKSTKNFTDEDWDTEYLGPVLSIRIVNGISEAMKHIALHGSGHTDGIITNSLKLSETFIAGVDSASVLVNASTRLSGGGDYGLGAVVGISTDRLHARGPVGPAELCTYKWVAVGNGQLRS